jgi:hypothetical protein
VLKQKYCEQGSLRYPPHTPTSRRGGGVVKGIKVSFEWMFDVNVFVLYVTKKKKIINHKKKNYF